MKTDVLLDSQPWSSVKKNYSHNCLMKSICFSENYSKKTFVFFILKWYWTPPTLWGKTRRPNTCMEQWTVCLKLKVFSNKWTEWPDFGYILRQYGIFDWKKYNSSRELSNRSTWDHTAVAAFNRCWWALFLLVLYSFSKPLHYLL